VICHLFSCTSRWRGRQPNRSAGELSTGNDNLAGHHYLPSKTPLGGSAHLESGGGAVRVKGYVHESMLSRLLPSAGTIWATRVVPKTASRPTTGRRTPRRNRFRPLSPRSRRPDARSSSRRKSGASVNAVAEAKTQEGPGRSGPELDERALLEIAHTLPVPAHARAGPSRWRDLADAALLWRSRR